MQHSSIYKRIVTLALAAVMTVSAAVCGVSLNMQGAYAAAEAIITLDVKNGEVIGEKLNAALLEAAAKADDKNPVTVRVPKGTYILDRTLHIYSNTVLDATGCTIVSDETRHNFFILGTNDSYNGIDKYNSSEYSSGYNSVRNVTVRGGVWVGNDSNTNTPVRLAHAKNISFIGLTLKGSSMSTHQVEAAGIDGFFVRGCTFRDFTPLSNMKGHFEAIQLDVPINTAIYNSSYHDGTPNKNVEIMGCNFINVSRGIGTHTMLVGAYHSNIRIIGNTFTNVQEEAIVALNYLDCTISGNQITNAGGGILFESAKFKPSDGEKKISSMHTTLFDGQQDYESDIIYDMKSTITNNVINIGYSPLCSRMIGIRIHGLELSEQYVGGDDMPLPVTNYYISGVKVTNNKIATAGGGILVDDARNITLSGNMVIQKDVSDLDESRDKYDGIYITSGCKSISISGGSVTGFTRYGILVSGESSVKGISSCNISSCGSHGIYFANSSSATGKVTGNTVKDCGGCGIALNTASNLSDITSNKISGSGTVGIYLTGGSSSGSIGSNTIQGSGTAAVSLKIGSKASSVKNNTITSPKSYGVAVNSLCSVKGAISGNTVKSAGGSGIILSGGTAGSISSNTVSSPKANGITLSGSAVVSGAVSKNTVSKPSQNGIALEKGSSAGAISTNTVTKPGKSGISLYNKASVSGNITANTVKTPAQYGIILDLGSSAKGITKNSISSSGKSGIFLYRKSKLTASISGNTVKSSKRHGIALETGSSVNSISTNTIKTTTNRAISLTDSSKAAGNMQKNTITTAKAGIFADKTSKVAGKIKGNVFKGVAKKAQVTVN